MHIEMDNRLAETIMEVQNVCCKRGLDIMDLPCGAMWMELVEVALSKINENPCYHPRFNAVGCQSGRIGGTGEPNIGGITKIS